jgi:NADH:ubiquinone reductase (H+-translocating)
VILGGGFGGLYAARSFRRIPVSVTLLDQHNFHLFQPLLYQVATGALSPANIAAPLRSVLKHQRNTQIILSKVIDIDPSKREVILDSNQRIPYDSAIIATGSQQHYFGNDQWRQRAPGLKTIEDAVAIRQKILRIFEHAEREALLGKTAPPLCFVIVGAGPTGVEMAGAIAELARYTLRQEFRKIDPAQTRINLIEGSDRILPLYPEDLSQKAVTKLEKLGVEILTKCAVTNIEENSISYKKDGAIQNLMINQIFWTAGVKASEFGSILAERLAIKTDKAGRIPVQMDLSVPGHPEIFVIGDLALFIQDNKALPGVAPVAMQEGRYVAKAIRMRLQGKTSFPFRYRDRGQMATIGRAAAIVDFKYWRFNGYLAWVIWLFVHLLYLVQFQNRLLVLIQWAWNYFTRNRYARLITDYRNY